MNGIDYCSESTRRHMASSSLAICGLARDCAATLPQNKALIEKLRTFFGSSMVVIVENDSSDQTRQQLDGWASECNDVFIIQGMPLQDEISTKKNAKSITLIPEWLIFLTVMLLLTLIIILIAALMIVLYAKPPAQHLESCDKRSCQSDLKLKCIKNICQCEKNHY